MGTGTKQYAIYHLEECPGGYRTRLRAPGHSRVRCGFHIANLNSLNVDVK